MGNETGNSTPGRKKGFTILITIFSLFIIYYTLMMMLSPARKLEAIKNEFAYKPSENSVTDESIFSDSTYLKLLKEKTLLQSKIVMAESDSIYLMINLTDSTANLEISGVVVHKANIIDFKISSILSKGDENTILSMLAAPFTISGAFSSIKKEPVMIKMAPKDTSEYKPDIMPDTSITEPVNYILEMTNGIRIYVYQAENDEHEDIVANRIFDLKDRLRNTWGAMKSVAVLEVPEYHPYIKLRLPAADAKIIYRAIPRYGQIGLYM
jgi:hypothetical protein